MSSAPCASAAKLADRVTGEDLPRAGERAQACRAVERAAPEAANDRNSLTRIEADPDRACELARGEAILQRDREAKRRPSRVEHNEHLVAAGLLERPAELGRQLGRNRLEPTCQCRTRLVPFRPGVGGVAPQVGEHERANRRGAHRRVDVLAANAAAVASISSEHVAYRSSRLLARAEAMTSSRAAGRSSRSVMRGGGVLA